MEVLEAPQVKPWQCDEFYDPATELVLDLQVSKRLEDVVNNIWLDYLLTFKRPQEKEELRQFICSIFGCAKKAMYKNRNNLYYNRGEHVKNELPRRAIDLIDWLAEPAQGYFFRIDAPRKHKFGTQTRASQLIIQDKLRMLLKDIPLKDCGIIKKKKIKYDPLQILSREDYACDFVNAHLIRQRITYTTAENKKNRNNNIPYHIDRELMFIYRKSSCGRYYTRGESIQSITKEERKNARINDEELIELDRKSSFPRIQYARQGILLPDDFDCYYIPCKGSQEICREIAKEVFVRMLFCSRPKNAVSAAQIRSGALRSCNYIINLKYKWDDELHCQVEKNDAEIVETIRFRKKMYLAGFGDLDFRPILIALEKRNPQIVKSLYNKENATAIFGIEGQMSLYYMYYFARKNETLLTLHDSGMIAPRHEDELKILMDWSLKECALYRNFHISYYI